jgi:hypothetical protein
VTMMPFGNVTFTDSSSPLATLERRTASATPPGLSITGTNAGAALQCAPTTECVSGSTAGSPGAFLNDPCIRASASRRHRPRRLEISRIISPTAWPKESLIRLNWSRSRNTVATARYAGQRTDGLRFKMHSFVATAHLGMPVLAHIHRNTQG